jgi:hypothetical protein
MFAVQGADAGKLALCLVVRVSQKVLGFCKFAD